MNTIKLSLWIILFIITFMEPTMAQPNLTKEQFSERLQKQEQDSKLEISSLEINGFEFPIKKIKNITFNNVEWSNIDSHEARFINVTFENCKLKNINMRNMHFENVKFKNCELLNVVMNEARIDEMVFENTKIISTDSNSHHSYRKLNAEKIIFIKSELKNINFFESKGQFSFESSSLSGVSGYGLSTGSSIKILDSKIIDMNFSDSDLLFVNIKDSHIIESRINDSSIGAVLLEENTFKKFSIASQKTYGTIKAIKNSDVAVSGTGPVSDVYIADCIPKTRIAILKLEFENAKINNCKVKDLAFFDAKGKTMVISHVDTFELDLEDAEIETLILKDVRIRGKIYMQNAKVKNYEAHNVVVDEKVKIKDKGANFKIESTSELLKM